MKKQLLILFIVCIACSCAKRSNNTDSDPYSGYIYSSTNSSDGNSIIALGRKSDGTLTELTGSPYSTGSTGDAGEGDFDTQNGLYIIGDYLIAVNAGNNPVNGNISVFKIDRTTGSLSRVDQNTSTPGINNIDSYGIRRLLFL